MLYPVDSGVIPFSVNLTVIGRFEFSSLESNPETFTLSSVKSIISGVPVALVTFMLPPA